MKEPDLVRALAAHALLTSMLFPKSDAGTRLDAFEYIIDRYARCELTTSDVQALLESEGPLVSHRPA